MIEKNSIREQNLIEWFLYRFLPFWPMFAAVLLFGLLCGWLYLRYTAPVYEATATLIINDERKGVDESQIMESINVFASKKIVENEIEVIRSRTLINVVVDELCLYAPIFEKRKIGSVSAYLSSPVTIKLKDPQSLPEKFEEAPEIYFTYDHHKKQVVMDGQKYALGSWVSTIYGELQFNPNKRKSKDQEGLLYFSLAHPKIIANQLLDNIDISPASKLSTVVNLSYQDGVAQRAEDILNHLIYAYNHSAVIERNKLAANTLEFIEERINQVEGELNQLELQVQQYKSSKNVIDLSEQGKLYLQNIGENDRKEAEINLQLAVLDKVEAYVASKENKEGIVPSTLGVNDPVLSQLLEKLYDSEIEFEKLRKTTAENNPMLISVRDEIDKIRPGILENIRNQRVNLEASLTRLKSSKGTYNDILRTIPQKEKELLEVTRQQAIKSNVYSFLLQKREETALSYAPTTADGRVVDMAESSVIPVSPKPILVYFVAIFFSIIVAVAHVLRKEALNHKILFRSEIEEHTDIPVVAEISRIKQSKNGLFSGPKDIALIEQFRQLRIMLGLYSRSFSKKRILVTSGIAGEGKSFVSSNLAYSLAQSGKRVVLLDMDLRKGSVTQHFGLANQTGIIDLLNDKATWESIINQTSFNQNLYVVPAGTLIGDYSENLLNQKLDLFFESLSEEFDYIVIDTSPVFLVPDAHLLAEYCDMTLLVVRHDHTPKNLIKNLQKSTKIRSINNVSIVFNGVKSRGIIEHGYGFGYGYNYKYYKV